MKVHDLIAFLKGCDQFAQVLAVDASDSPVEDGVAVTQAYEVCLACGDCCAGVYLVTE